MIRDFLLRFLRAMGKLLRRSVRWLLGPLLFITLISYHPYDPTWSTATSEHTRHLFGAPGAFLAACLLQFLGMASLVLTGFFLAWPWLCRYKKHPLLYALSFSLALVGVATLLSWHTPYQGGMLGELFLGHFSVFEKFWWARLALGIITLIALLHAFGLTRRLFLHSLLNSWLFIRFMAAVIGWSMRHIRAHIQTWPHRIRSLFKNTQETFHMLKNTQRNMAAENNPFNKTPLAKVFSHQAALEASNEAHAQPFPHPSHTAPTQTSAREGEPFERGIFQDTLSPERAQDTVPPAGTQNDAQSHHPPFRLMPKGSAIEAKPTPQTLSLPSFEAFKRHDAEKRKPPELHTVKGLLPELDILYTYDTKTTQSSPQEMEAQTHALIRVLEEFGIQGTIQSVKEGPVVTLYELEPAPGIKSSRVIGLADDIARSMSALSTRVSVIPGKNALGIEIPNKNRDMVFLKEILESAAFKDQKMSLPLSLGKDISGGPIVVDLARMPHLLVAGTTGSGKSVGINAMVLSLLFRLTPNQCQLLMIDPKMLELSVYNNIPHLIAPVITDPKKAVEALKWAVFEMEKRYQMMSGIHVRNIQGFNKKVKAAQETGQTLNRKIQTGYDDEGTPLIEERPIPLDLLPYLVIIVDEMADLMLVAGKEIEGAIQRLAQMARAAGIHLVMATQRPSVDVITGTIKANFPSRISFQVTSKIDSRTILGEQGAEQLLGQGDMLYMSPGKRTLRVHGPFVSDEEVERVVDFLKKAYPNYKPLTSFDPHKPLDSLLSTNSDSGSSDLYQKAVDIVLKDRKTSISYLQRRLQIGYNRAASLIEEMEEKGILSAPGHTGKRSILDEA